MAASVDWFVKAGNAANLVAREGVVKIEMPRPELKVVEV